MLTLRPELKSNLIDYFNTNAQDDQNKTKYFILVGSPEDKTLGFFRETLDEVLIDYPHLKKNFLNVDIEKLEVLSLDNELDLKDNTLNSLLNCIGNTLIVNNSNFQSGMERKKEEFSSQLNYIIVNAQDEHFQKFFHKLNFLIHSYKTFGFKNFERPFDKEIFKQNMDIMVYQLSANNKRGKIPPNRTFDNILGNILTHHKRSDKELSVSPNSTGSATNHSSNSNDIREFSFGPQENGSLKENDDNNLCILVFSWNVAGYRPENASELPQISSIFDKNKLPQIISIGLQEVIELKGFAGAMSIFTSEEKIISTWASVFSEIISHIDPQYELVQQEMLVGLLSLTYVHRGYSHRIAAQSVEEVKMGMNGYVGTKGTIISTLSIDDKRFIRFGNCHLASGEENADKRTESIEEIFTTYCRKGVSDIFFLFGDLNTRVICSNEEYRDAIGNGKVSQPNINYPFLLSKDEVNLGFQKCLSNEFLEGEISFPMTYRFKKKAQERSYTLDRIASWYVLIKKGQTGYSFG